MTPRVADKIEDVSDLLDAGESAHVDLAALITEREKGMPRWHLFPPDPDAAKHRAELQEWLDDHRAGVPDAAELLEKRSRRYERQRT